MARMARMAILVPRKEGGGSESADGQDARMARMAILVPPGPTGRSLKVTLGWQDGTLEREDGSGWIRMARMAHPGP